MSDGTLSHFCSSSICLFVPSIIALVVGDKGTDFSRNFLSGDISATIHSTLGIKAMNVPLLRFDNPFCSLPHCCPMQSQAWHGTCSPCTNNQIDVHSTLYVRTLLQFESHSATLHWISYSHFGWGRVTFRFRVEFCTGRIARKRDVTRPCHKNVSLEEHGAY